MYYIRLNTVNDARYDKYFGTHNATDFWNFNKRIINYDLFRLSPCQRGLEQVIKNPIYHKYLTKRHLNNPWTPHPENMSWV